MMGKINTQHGIDVRAYTCHSPCASHFWGLGLGYMCETGFFFASLGVRVASHRIEFFWCVNSIARWERVNPSVCYATEVGQIRSSAECRGPEWAIFYCTIYDCLLYTIYLAPNCMGGNLMCIMNSASVSRRCIEMVYINILQLVVVEH